MEGGYDLENKKQISAIAALCAVLIVVLAVGAIKEKKQDKQNLADYNAWLEQKSSEKGEAQVQIDQREQKAEENKTEAESAKNENFYKKLAKKEKVKVLIIGDGIALSEGKTSEDGVWQNGVSYIIKNTYGCESEVVSLAKNKSKVSDGIKVVGNNDVKDYDLIITCFGHNDSRDKISIDEFKTNYVTLITKLKEANGNVIIMPIVESTLEKDNVYRNAIINTCSESSIDYADMKLAFEKSGIIERNLENNDLPNNTGYQIYTQTIGEVIKAGMAKNK